MIYYALYKKQGQLNQLISFLSGRERDNYIFNNCVDFMATEEENLKNGYAYEPDETELKSFNIT